MQAQRAGRSSGDAATEANALLAGLGILTIQVVPLALPGLLLFVIAPLALVAVVGVLLAAPFVLPAWLTRIVLRRRSRRRTPAVQASGETRTAAARQSAATP
jgi:hypothetical protein